MVPNLQGFNLHFFILFYFLLFKIGFLYLLISEREGRSREREMSIS